MDEQAAHQPIRLPEVRTGPPPREGVGRTSRITILGLVATSVLVMVGLLSWARTDANMPSKSGYLPIDGIPCQRAAQGGAHYHVHVAIYIAGKRTLVPADIGIANDGSCAYWVHTHDAGGVLHVESPDRVSVTLGNFLDIWNQQFRHMGYPSLLSVEAGWQTYVDGTPLTSGMHAIVLRSHLLITLAYNSPTIKPDTNYTWDGL